MCSSFLCDTKHDIRTQHLVSWQEVLQRKLFTEHKLNPILTLTLIKPVTPGVTL